MATIASYNKRLEALKSERSHQLPMWRDLAENFLRHRGRFLSTDRNKAPKRNLKQPNNTGRLAVRTLGAGMMAGVTSPSRPWFRLGTAEPWLREVPAAREWLYAVEQIMYRVYSASNLYDSLHTMYSDAGVFGTSALGIFEDFENVIWTQTYPVGSYMLATNGQNVVDTFYREFSLTVSECIKRFGEENCSHEVRQRWKTGATESMVKIVHVVEPNDDRDRQSPLAKDMPFRSVYYESSAGKGHGDKFLKESGFEEFPIMTPRWEVTGEDVYATDCPGMIAIGDNKSLQLGERRKYQIVDKVANPKLQVPSSMRNKFESSRPDEPIYVTSTSESVKSVYNIHPSSIQQVEAVNDKADMRINKAFHVDLFRAVMDSSRRQITATEIDAIEGEKLLMLGPALERFHKELDLLNDRVFNILMRAGVLPPAPPELEGQELKIEYVSVLAQAQRRSATSGIEAVSAFASSLAPTWPEARHKVNSQQAIDRYAEAVGTPPDIINSDEVVAGKMQAEAQQMQAAQQAEQISKAADVAKTASEIDVSEGSAVGDAMRRSGVL